MSWLETLRTGLSAVLSHRLRSGLTMLGILIGIAAVILTVGFGEGAQAQVSGEINDLGSNLLVVSPGSSTASTGIRGGFGENRGADSIMASRARTPRLYRSGSSSPGTCPRHQRMDG